MNPSAVLTATRELRGADRPADALQRPARPQPDGEVVLEQALALADLAAVHDTAPGAPDVVTTMGDVLATSGRYDTAAVADERALAVDPTHPRALRRRAVVLGVAPRAALPHSDRSHAGSEPDPGGPR